MDEIRKASSDKKTIEQCLKELRQNSAEEIKTLKKELSFLKRQFQEVSEKKEKTLGWLAQTLPDKNVTNRISNEVEQLNAQIDNLKRAISETETKLERSEIGEVKTELIASFFDDFLNCFKEWNEPQRKLTIRLVVNKVIVYSKDKIKIILSLPLPTNNKFINLPVKKGTAEPDACGVHDATVPIFTLSGVPHV